LEQHFWQPFEVAYRFQRNGFTLNGSRSPPVWKEFAGGKDLQDYPPPWDWFFPGEIRA